MAVDLTHLNKCVVIGMGDLEKLDYLTPDGRSGTMAELKTAEDGLKSFEI